jgi:23S rRNA (pseudouridine1915-N3)-methyltransferase
MNIHIITIGRRPPKWVLEGFHEYEKRLPQHFKITVQDLAPSKRYTSAKAKNLSHAERQLAITEEGQSMLMSIPSGSFVVALDEKGPELSTIEFSKALRHWQESAKPLAFLIGGADGLAPACKQRANLCLALSRMTFPHQLIRVFLIEQLYRAWSVLSGHPYHRD